MIAVLTVAVMGSQLPSSLQFGRFAPASILVTILWLAGVFLLGKSRGHLPWQRSGEAPDHQQPPQGHAKQVKNQHATAKKISTTRAGLIFVIAAAATLAAGYALEQSGDQIAGTSG